MWLQGPSYTNVFADALIAEAERDSRIIGIHAAMGGGTGLNRFDARFHDRTFDVGIAEQHAVTFAAGLACDGLKPFCTIYSTFLQRGYDQIIHDVCLQNLPGEPNPEILHPMLLCPWRCAVSIQSAGAVQVAAVHNLHPCQAAEPDHE